MSKKYPLINGSRRRPNKEKDGSKNYGLPCVICGKNTIGENGCKLAICAGKTKPLGFAQTTGKKANN